MDLSSGYLKLSKGLTCQPFEQVTIRRIDQFAVADGFTELRKTKLQPDLTGS